MAWIGMDIVAYYGIWRTCRYVTSRGFIVTMRGVMQYTYVDEHFNIRTRGGYVLDLEETPTNYWGQIDIRGSLKYTHAYDTYNFFFIELCFKREGIQIPLVIV